MELIVGLVVCLLLCVIVVCITAARLAARNNDYNTKVLEFKYRQMERTQK